MATRIRAVIFDFGGVVLTSPFEAFSRYEREHGLPDGFIRQVNATNPDDNAWARLERNEVDLAGFGVLFEAEARGLGHPVDAQGVLALLGGEIRPEMVEAVRRCGERLRTALLTNNPPPDPALPPLMAATPSPLSSRGVSSNGDGPRPAPRPEIAQVVALFDVVVESSVTGLRKPDPRIYDLVCDQLDVAPAEAVFLDDLGINLKPARAMGMTTIKVTDPAAALAELEAVVGFPLG